MENKIGMSKILKMVAFEPKRKTNDFFDSCYHLENLFEVKISLDKKIEDQTTKLVDELKIFFKKDKDFSKVESILELKLVDFDSKMDGKSLLDLICLQILNFGNNKLNEFVYSGICFGEVIKISEINLNISKLLNLFFKKYEIVTNLIHSSKEDNSGVIGIKIL